jgi:hypothetical protein
MAGTEAWLAVTAEQREAGRMAGSKAFNLAAALVFRSFI